MTTALAVIVARYLGPADFGIFSGFLGLAQVVTLLAGVGLPVWLLRELSNALATKSRDERDQSERQLSAALAIVGTTTIVLTVGSFAIGKLVVASADLALSLGALMAYVGLLSCSTILEVVFRANRRLSSVVAATALEKLSLLGIVVALTSAGADVAGIAAGYVAAGVVRVSWDIHALRRSRLVTLVRPTRSDFRTVVFGAIPVGLGSTIPTAVVRLDVFLIAMFSLATAGFYAVADRVVNVLSIIPVACSYALYPHLARKPDALSSSCRLAGALAVVGALLAAVAGLVAPVLVPLLFSEEYAAAVGGLRIMLLAVPLIFAANVLTAGLFCAGLERRVLMVTTLCAGGGVGFVAAGTALWGLEGAAAGFVARYVTLVLGLGLVLLTRPSGGQKSTESRLDASVVDAGGPRVTPVA